MKQLNLLTNPEKNYEKLTKLVRELNSHTHNETIFKIVTTLAKFKPVKEIVKDTQLAYSTVYRYMKKAGITNIETIKREKEREPVLEMLKYKSVPEVHRITKIPKPTLYLLRIKHGIKGINKKFKFIPVEVKMRALDRVHKGERIYTVAHDLGVTTQSIYNWLNDLYLTR